MDKVTTGVPTMISNTTRRVRRGGRAGTLALTLLAVALPVSACATPSAGDGKTPASSASSATFAGAITQPLVYANVGISLVPPVKVGTVVSWQSVLASCDTGDAICDPKGGATVTLADATVSGSGTAQADGSLAPLMKSRLVYVLTFTGVACMPKGPPPKQTAAPSSSAQSCTLINR